MFLKSSWLLGCSTILLLYIVACPLASAASPRDYLKKTDPWYQSEEGRRIARTILSYQAETGSWPKNTDTTQTPYEGNRSSLRGTFDNGATTDELRFLARSYVATDDASCKEAFLLGLNHILEAQYTNGGWPQYYPLSTSYNRHITFNDYAMVRLMEFLREVANQPEYEFVDRSLRRKAAEAFDRGIACILKCQIIVDGRRTAWCAQHDEIDFRPRPARSYELVSISGNESVGIVRLLMSLENPSDEVKRAIESAVAWFEKVKLTGIREETQDDPLGPGGKNKVVVNNPDAPPIWGRFYQIGTNRPMFVDRDGVPKYRLDQIGYERRNGYAWLGNWPGRLLEVDYPAWKHKYVTD